jgi:hypothetical protein
MVWKYIGTEVWVWFSQFIYIWYHVERVYEADLVPVLAWGSRVKHGGMMQGNNNQDIARAKSSANQRMFGHEVCREYNKNAGGFAWLGEGYVESAKDLLCDET